MNGGGSDPTGCCSGAPARCIACGALPQAGLWLRTAPRGPIRLQRCPRCLLAWWDWPAFDPQAFYDEGYFQSSTEAKGYDNYAGLEAGVVRTAQARLQRIERLLGRAAATERGMQAGPRLLELGCGTGVFLEQAQRRGWDVQGIEVSAYGAEQARRRGLDVRTAAVERLKLPHAALDCVALWDVIEHLRDPVGVLDAAGRALRPGGVLALSTGDVTSLCARLSRAGWHLFNLPEHLFFFSPGALRRLLRRAGCNVAALEREVNWVPASYLIERLQKSGGLIGRTLGWVGQHAALAPRLARMNVPATLADVVGVYAVRTEIPRL